MVDGGSGYSLFTDSQLTSDSKIVESLNSTYAFMGMGICGGAEREKLLSLEVKMHRD